MDNFDQALDVKSALKKCLQISNDHVKLAKGSDEIIKTYMRNDGFELLVVAKDLHDKYKKVLLALSEKKGVYVIEIESRAELAKISPFKAKKVGAVAIRDFVMETKERMHLASVIKGQQ